MSFLNKITVLILTFNEESNIGRTLQGVSWAKRIIVVDSGSTDATHDIVRGYPQAEVIVRPFDNHQAQWNFGLECCGSGSEWILALDADYYIDADCRNTLDELKPAKNIVGYRASFRYCVFGRILRGNLYPPAVVLFRRLGAHYIQTGHTQRLVTAGGIAALKTPIFHDDRKSFSHWLSSQQKYAKLEADYLLATARAKLRRSDRIRRLAWPAPVIVFLYTLIAKRCILDGWAGWYYVLQRTLAEILIAIEILDRRLPLPEGAGVFRSSTNPQNE